MSSSETLDRMLAGPGGGRPIIGADWVQRYFQVMQGFARAVQLKLEQQLEARNGRSIGHHAT